jgi:hypothetical protein
MTLRQDAKSKDALVEALRKGKSPAAHVIADLLDECGPWKRARGRPRKYDRQGPLYWRVWEAVNAEVAKGEKVESAYALAARKYANQGLTKHSVKRMYEGETNRGYREALVGGHVRTRTRRK